MQVPEMQILEVDYFGIFLFRLDSISPNATYFSDHELHRLSDASLEGEDAELGSPWILPSDPWDAQLIPMEPNPNLYSKYEGRGFVANLNNFLRL